MQGKQNYVGSRQASIYIVYLPAQLLLDLEVYGYMLPFEWVLLKVSCMIHVQEC